MQKCKFCAISHLIWLTQSKSVKSWTFLGEIVVNLIPLNRFHSESRLHGPKTRKSQRHHALGRMMSQKGKSTCNITIYGRRWGWGVKFRGQKKLPTPGSKFFPGTPWDKSLLHKKNSNNQGEGSWDDLKRKKLQHYRVYLMSLGLRIWWFSLSRMVGEASNHFDSQKGKHHFTASHVTVMRLGCSRSNASPCRSALTPS